MSISTLEKLQELKDAEFHALGDEILPRILPKYYPIVPYGRNQKGDSIIGQPDSYIGETVETCTIAIQYTVQKRSWWSKAIEDVKDARKACPHAKEIVLVLPRDIDREKPSKGDGINWFQEAKKVAKPVKLTIIHGKKIEQQLDTGSQDLRLNYLDIPYSRLSWEALVAGCSEFTAKTINRLKSLERYDSERYIDRIADDHLFRLWQESLRNASVSSSSSQKKTIIPLIADSGIGKTSLLARFSERASPHAPVLFLLARDLSFESNDSLIKHIISGLVGSMDTSLHNAEETHIASKINGKTPLTIILDGLDEVTNVAGLSRAITSWVLSRLGRVCVVIFSSRPEFWRNCRDNSWSSYILTDSDYPKAVKNLSQEKELSDLDPMKGIELPGKFSNNELVKAWVLGGQKEDEFWKLPKETRNELSHPFTLRSALDLLNEGRSLGDLTTRTSIINEWLKSRFNKEKSNQLRLTESQFWKSLLIIAQLAIDTDGGWVSIDNLHEVPRFDSSKPPGPVIDKLILANILETHQEESDQIRFSFESIQDFFLAESIINEIEIDPENVAKKFAGIPFSIAVTRLERIGNQIAKKNFREKFLKALAELDGIKAIVVLKSSIDTYSSKCRELVVYKVAELLNSKMIADQALACQLLGRLICRESKEVLKTHWTTHQPNKRIHWLVSHTAISLGIVELIPIVFKRRWFTSENFFVNLRPEIMGSTKEFRESLSEYSLRFISSEEHSRDYQRALMILSYLKDDRAVDAVKKSTKDRFPFYYESLCLLAIGSSKAVNLYSSLIDRYLKAKESGLNEDEEQKLWNAVVPYARIANLVTPEIEQFVCNQLDSDDTQRQLIGRFLADWIGTEKLLLHKVKRFRVEGYVTLFDNDLGKKIGAENWVNLWETSKTKDEKNDLIQIAGDLKNSQVEDILIQSVDDPDLAGQSVQSLGKMGSQRACPGIRQLLLNLIHSGNDKDWKCQVAFIALARLRDPSSVPIMVKYLESENKVEKYLSIVGLAGIDTEEAEQALMGLKNIPDELLVRGLLHYGTNKCVCKAIEIAKQKEKGELWLAEHCKYSMHGVHGRSMRQYRSDIDIEPFLNYVLGNEPDTKVYDYLRSLLNEIDTPPVRKLYRQWYDLKDSDKDIILDSPKDTKLSEIAFRELADRGDDHVLNDFLEREVERYKKYQISDFMIDDITFFEREKVQQTLRVKYEDENNDEKSRRYILDLIGHLGDVNSDISFLNKIIDEQTGIVANAAYEAKLRLTDTLRLAENW